jgi:hypothetical protein
MKLLSSFAFIVSMLIAGASNAQQLWQGTTYGMTPDEVAAVVTGVVKPQKLSTLGTGATELLTLPELELVGKKFAVHFYFKGDRLDQVTISLSATNENYGATSVIFDSLKDALNVRYGAGSERPEQRGLMRVKQATWQSDRTNITLITMTVQDAPAILNLVYQVRIASIADKL